MVARVCPSAKLLSRCFIKITILGFLSCAVTLLPGSARLGPASPPLSSPAANLLCLIICFPITSLSLLAEKLSALVMWTRSLGLQPGAVFDAWNIFIPIKRWREGELLSHWVDWVFFRGLIRASVCDGLYSSGAAHKEAFLSSFSEILTYTRSGKKNDWL